MKGFWKPWASWTLLGSVCNREWHLPIPTGGVGATYSQAKAREHTKIGGVQGSCHLASDNTWYLSYSYRTLNLPNLPYIAYLTLSSMITTPFITTERFKVLPVSRQRVWNLGDSPWFGVSISWGQPTERVQAPQDRGIITCPKYYTPRGRGLSKRALSRF